MSDKRYAVLFRPEARPDMALVAAMIAAIRSIPRFDAVRTLADCAGIVCRDLGEEDARVLAAGLTAKGMPAISIAEERLVPLPPATIIGEARLEEMSLLVRPLGATEDTLFEDIPWRRVRFLVGARVHSTEIVTRISVKQELVRRGTTREGGVGVQFRPQQEQMEQSTWAYILDILVNAPWRRYRIIADRFFYRSTGLPRQAASFANFALLVRAIVEHAASAVVDRSVRLILDGDPLTRLEARSPQQYENYLLWRLQFLGEAEDA